jgi:hypothetical protein
MYPRGTCSSEKEMNIPIVTPALSQGPEPTGYVLTRREEVIYPHATLWAVTQRMYRAACRRKKGQTHYDLLVLLGIPLTLEAYLNLVLMELLPEDWKAERQLREGARSKLQLIIERLSLPAVDKTYATIDPLLDLRDSLVHAKPIQRVNQYVHAQRDDPFLLSSWMSEEISHDRVKVAMRDFKLFLEKFHKPIYERSLVSATMLPLSPVALGGLVSRGSGSSKPLYPGDTVPSKAKRIEVKKKTLRAAGLVVED